MANTNTNIMPRILARGLQVLRENASMPRLVNGDYSAEAARKGTTIDIPVPTATTTTDVTPSNTPPAGVDKNYDLVQISLNQWKKNQPFYLTDKELAEIDANQHFIPMAVDESMRALAQTVNQYIFSMYKGVFGFYGTPGTTPFATDVKGATQTRAILNTQKCPKANRRGMLDFTAEANFLELAQFANLEQTGDQAVKIEGQMGRKYGNDWYSDDDVPFHTAGTGAGYLVNNVAGYAAGTKTIAVDTGTGTIVQGDIITFAGSTQTYAVTSALSGNNISFYPGLVTTLADNTAITLKASHRVNLIFHRDAFAFATRSLQDDGDANTVTMQDPKTGLVLRLEKIREYKQTLYEFDILYGAQLVRPELACRLAG
jgi:hypothetical protein